MGTAGWKPSEGKSQEAQKVHFAQVEFPLRSPNRDLKYKIWADWQGNVGLQYHGHI